MTNEMYWAICEACRAAGMCYPSKAFAEVIYKSAKEYIDGRTR